MISELRARTRELVERVDELSLRERALVFVGVLAVMYIGTMQLVIQPLTDQRARLDKELKVKREQMQATERQIQAMLGGGVTDDDAAKRARLNALLQQLQVLDAEMNRTTAGLVTPKEMSQLLRQYLAAKRGLQVVKVESLPPEPLVNEGTRASTSPGASATAPVAAQVYKHGMRIELRGGYLDMLGYLEGLERLPWKVFWGQVALQSEQYPVSKMTLVIYTLSTREGWIAI